MVAYCLEEQQCLHNILLHYFSDKTALPSGYCGGCCDNCMRRMKLPGAPPPRLISSKSSTRANKASAGTGSTAGFVKASSLLAQQPGEHASSKRRARTARPAGTSTVKKTSEKHVAVWADNWDNAEALEDHGRDSKLAARAKNMKVAAIAQQNKVRIKQMQQRMAVEACKK
jgi:superfamily II DNA helicase RecQ